MSLTENPSGVPGAVDPALRRARLEVAAVIATGTLHVIFESILDAKVIFLPIAIVAWIAYLFVRVRREPSVPKEWGFRTDTFRPAFRLSTLIGFPAAVLLVAGAQLLGNSIWSLSFLVLFLVYPVWGLAQQFLLQGLLAANLERIVQNRFATTALAAFLFGLVHAPDWILSALTFGLGIVFVPIYLATRNLYALGLYHGWLGTLAYCGVLGRNPVEEALQFFQTVS
jgi:hypothetical protein